MANANEFKEKLDDLSNDMHRLNAAIGKYLDDSRGKITNLLADGSPEAVQDAAKAFRQYSDHTRTSSALHNQNLLQLQFLANSAADGLSTLDYLVRPDDADLTRFKNGLDRATTSLSSAFRAKTTSASPSLSPETEATLEEIVPKLKGYEGMNAAQFKEVIERKIFALNQLAQGKEVPVVVDPTTAKEAGKSQGAAVSEEHKK